MKNTFLKTIALLSTLLMMLLITSTLSAQSWQVIGSNYYAADISETGTMIMVGENGMIMRSSDWGITWDVSENDSPYATLDNVVWTGDSIWFATGPDRTVSIGWKDGRVWQKRDHFPLDTLLFLKSPLNKIVFASSRTRFTMSSDHGIDWKPSKSYPEAINEMCWQDQNKGFIIGNGGKLWNTVDRGENWNRIDIGTTVNLTAISFSRDGKYGLVAGDSGFVFHSVDSGVTWIGSQVEDHRFTAISASVLSGSTLIIGGKTSALISESNAYKSTDGGSTWTLVPVPYFRNAREVYNITSRSGISLMTADQGGVFISRDNWTSLDTVTDMYHMIPQYGASNFYYPGISSDSVVVVPTQKGGMIRSTDAGTTWSFQVVAENTLSYTAMSNDSGITFRSIERPFITTNGGQTWQELSSSADVPATFLFGSKFFSAMYGYVVGGTGSGVPTTGNYLYRTEDGGKNFSSRPLPSVDVVAQMDFISPEIGIIAGRSSPTDPDSIAKQYYEVDLFKTTDSGKSWTSILRTVETLASPVMLKMLTPEHYLVSISGNPFAVRPSRVLETKDGGGEWSVILTSELPIHDLLPLNETLWYAVGYQGAIYRSDDAGKNWEKEEVLSIELPRPFFPHLNRIVLLNDDQTVLVFGNGTILRKRFESKLSSVKSVAANPIGSQGLLFIAPNPASIEITVSWDELSSNVQRLVISDVRGVAVRTINEVPAGADEVNVSLSDLASGLYTISLLDENGLQLKSERVVVRR